MDGEDGGLFNIEVSDDEGEREQKEARRTGQTEEAFQAVKREYKPKVEDGDVSTLIHSRRIRG